MTRFELHHKRLHAEVAMVDAEKMHGRGMDIDTNSYTYHDVFKILTSTEQNILMYIGNYYMTEDNLVYLYQELRPKRRIIDNVSDAIGITTKEVARLVKRIESKQSIFRWMICDTHSGIHGEYLISPYLIRHQYVSLRKIKEIMTRIENQPKHFNWLKAEYNPKANWFRVGSKDEPIKHVQNRKKGNHNRYKRRGKVVE